MGEFGTGLEAAFGETWTRGVKNALGLMWGTKRMDLATK